MSSRVKPDDNLPLMTWRARPDMSCEHVSPAWLEFTGARPEDTFCSYACTEASECPEDWTCDPADAWSSVPGAVEDVTRVCRPPRRR